MCHAPASSWNAPSGDLYGDRRHVVRAWTIWNAVSTRRHGLGVSGLLNFWSGAPYSAVAKIDVSNYVENPGYATPAVLQDYFFSDRGEFRTDDIFSLDVALNYTFTFPTILNGLSIFVQPEVRNLLNNQGAIGHDSTVVVVTEEPFNPWNETPVLGQHYDLGENFGQPVSESHYQPPRTFLISLGVRF